MTDRAGSSPARVRRSAVRGFRQRGFDPRQPLTARRSRVAGPCARQDCGGRRPAGGGCRRAPSVARGVRRASPIPCRWWRATSPGWSGGRLRDPDATEPDRPRRRASETWSAPSRVRWKRPGFPPGRGPSPPVREGGVVRSERVRGHTSRLRQAVGLARRDELRHAQGGEGLRPDPLGGSGGFGSHTPGGAARSGPHASRVRESRVPRALRVRDRS